MLCHARRMAMISLLDRPVYLYHEVDRLVGVRPGTARRWVNGYTRAGKSYEPILRTRMTDAEWVTWGEFVETRILAEYRDQHVPTARLRAAVQELRVIFDMEYPLAHLRPYLEAEAGELAIDRHMVDPDDGPGLMVLRTRQLLLRGPSREVMDHATLADDARGEPFAAELPADEEFPGIVLSPERYGGQPTFLGRRISVATIAGMVAAGEYPADLAADYGLSMAQVQTAVAYATKHPSVA